MLHRHYLLDPVVRQGESLQVGVGGLAHVQLPDVVALQVELRHRGGDYEVHFGEFVAG
jgi:hypothetical protein